MGYRLDNMKFDERNYNFKREIYFGKKLNRKNLYKIKSIKPLERLQVDMVYLSDYLVGDKR